MARAFSVTLPTANFAAAADLLRVSAPTGFKMRVLHASAGAVSSETSDVVPFGLYFASVAGTGSALNVVGLDGHSNQTDFAAWGGTCIHTVTGATKSPAEPAVYEAADLSVGWEWDREEDIDWMDVPAGKHLVLRMDGAPVASTAITARLVFELI
jgi:hypothetical protein